MFEHGEETATTKRRSGAEASRDETTPYGGKKPFGAIDDLVMEGALDLDGDDRLWVPQSADVSFKPLALSVSNGYFVNILKVRKQGILSRHRHAGRVHATVLRGRWHYLEHPWWAEEGSYVFEPPGDIHTLEIPDGVEEMATRFHVTGAYIYVDPNGVPTGIEDVFTEIEKARALPSIDVSSRRAFADCRPRTHGNGPVHHAVERATRRVSTTLATRSGGAGTDSGSAAERIRITPRSRSPNISTGSAAAVLLGCGARPSMERHHTADGSFHSLPSRRKPEYPLSTTSARRFR